MYRLSSSSSSGLLAAATRSARLANPFSTSTARPDDDSFAPRERTAGKGHAHTPLNVNREGRGRPDNRHQRSESHSSPQQTDLPPSSSFRQPGSGPSWGLQQRRDDFSRHTPGAGQQQQQQSSSREPRSAQSTEDHPETSFKPQRRAWGEHSSSNPERRRSGSAPARVLLGEVQDDSAHDPTPAEAYNQSLHTKTNSKAAYFYEQQSQSPFRQAGTGALRANDKQRRQGDKEPLKSFDRQQLSRATREVINAASAAPNRRPVLKQGANANSPTFGLAAGFKLGSAAAYKGKGRGKGPMPLAQLFSGDKRTDAKGRSRSAAPSTELQKFDAMRMDETEETGAMMQINAGDLIESRRNNVALYGIVLGEEFHIDVWRLVCLSSTGEVWRPLKHDAMFVVPAAASRDLVARATTSVITSRPSEVAARVELLKILRNFERATTPLFNSLEYIITRTLWEKAAKDDEWTSITLADAVGVLQPNRTGVVPTFAVHKQLMARSLQFEADQMYQHNKVVHVRPKSHVATLHKVMSWIREGENGPLGAFVGRAKPFMERNRTRMRERWAEKPSAVPFEEGELPWTEDDYAVIEFLKHSLRQTRSTQTDPYVVGVLGILKAFHITAGDVHETQVWDLLVDLGVMAPWQDMVSLRHELTSRETKTELIAANQLPTEALADEEKTIQFLKDHGLHIQDPLSGIRHDFGDLPVYVIDDASAEELDDGISIEAVPDEPGNYWLHGHIADPASVIPPTHPWSLDAQKKTSTVYFNQSTLPLFRPEVNRLSGLGSSLHTGKPERVMTFSAKIDEKGVILDHKVRAGLIRNIRILRYDDVDTAVGPALASHEPIYSYPFGGGSSPPTTPPIHSPTPGDVEQLTDIFRVTRRIIQKKVDEGYYVFTTPSANIALHARPAPPSLPMGTPMAYVGFPSWTYAVSHSEASDLGARSLVAEVMKLSGRVASMFFRDRNIPALRRFAPPSSVSDLPGLLAKRTANANIGVYERLKYDVVYLPAGYCLDVRGHFGMGISAEEGYCRSTSPLRRYADLVAHWMMQRALLLESGTTTKEEVGRVLGPEVFTEDWLKTYMGFLSVDEARIKNMQVMNGKFWVTYYLKALLEGRFDPSLEVSQSAPTPAAESAPAPAPESESESGLATASEGTQAHGRDMVLQKEFEGFLMTDVFSAAMSPGWSAKAFVPSLGIMAEVSGVKYTGKSTVGELVRLRLKDVMLGGRPKVLFEQV